MQYIAVLPLVPALWLDCVLYPWHATYPSFARDSAWNAAGKPHVIWPVFGGTLNLTQPNHGTLKKNSSLKRVGVSGWRNWFIAYIRCLFCFISEAVFLCWKILAFAIDVQMKIILHCCTDSWIFLYSWNVVWCKTWQHVDTVHVLASKPQHWQNPTFLSLIHQLLHQVRPFLAFVLPPKKNVNNCLHKNAVSINE